MGSLLLSAGAKGMRTSLPNARIMVHQPSGGAEVYIYYLVWILVLQLLPYFA